MEEGEGRTGKRVGERGKERGMEWRRGRGEQVRVWERGVRRGEWNGGEGGENR